MLIAHRNNTVTDLNHYQTFVVVDGTTDREWAYVAMGRGRRNNTLYLAKPELADEQCTHQDPHDPLERLTAALNRSSTQIGAVDQTGETPDEADPLGPPPSGDVTARVAWQIARRQAERAEAQRWTLGIDLAAGR